MLFTLTSPEWKHHGLQPLFILEVLFVFKCIKIKGNHYTTNLNVITASLRQHLNSVILYITHIEYKWIPQKQGN